MPLIAFTIKLERIDEELLYHDPGGGVWLSCICTLDTDAKGRMVVAQSVPKERYAAGEKGPALGVWRELGGGNHTSSGKPAFDLSKYKKPLAPEQPPPAPEGAGDPPLFPDDEEGAP